MNLSDFLNVELYDDNLEMFNQAWEETLWALGNDLDEHILEKLYERHVQQCTLQRNAVAFVSV